VVNRPQSLVDPRIVLVAFILAAYRADADAWWTAFALGINAVRAAYRDATRAFVRAMLEHALSKMVSQASREYPKQEVRPKVRRVRVIGAMPQFSRPVIESFVRLYFNTAMFRATQALPNPVDYDTLPRMP